MKLKLLLTNTANNLLIIIYLIENKMSAIIDGIISAIIKAHPMP